MNTKTFKHLKSTDIIYYIDSSENIIYEQKINVKRCTLTPNGFNVIKDSDTIAGHGVPNYLNDTIELVPVKEDAILINFYDENYFFNLSDAEHELDIKINEIISKANYYFNKAKKEYEDILLKYKSRKI